MRKVLLILIIPIALMLMSFESCQNKRKDSDANMQANQEKILREADAQAGMPAIKNFQEKKLLKMIMELRDQENLICYAYLWNEFNGKLIYLGKCMGYGLPYATQYTNPQKTVYPGGYNESFGSLPQADPNGLFMPQAAEGTWIMLIDNKTHQPRPVYCEPRVLISPFPLEI